MKTHTCSIALIITFFIGFLGFYGATTAYESYVNTQAVYEESQADQRQTAAETKEQNKALVQCMTTRYKIEYVSGNIWRDRRGDIITISDYGSCENRQ